jgi:O-antigen ligase
MLGRSDSGNQSDHGTRRKETQKRERLGDLLRCTSLALLVGAPLGEAATYALPYTSVFLGVAFGVGFLSWARGHWERAQGGFVPLVPGRRLLVGFGALIALQLVPLPPGLLRLLSPGSYRFYSGALLLPLTEWRPISVDAAFTLAGLAFFAAVGLFYAAILRDFSEQAWRRRLAATVVGTALLMTIEALVQAASSEPTKVFGIWRLEVDWGVFGPYSNRNHFAGYVIMAIPLSLGFAAAAFGEVRRAWNRRRAHWTALGEPAATAALWRSAIAMVLIVGVVATQSRGGLMGFALSAVALPFFFRRRILAAAGVALVALLGSSWVDFSGVVQGFESRGVRGSRLDLWSDVLRMVPEFPLFGAGFNAFGTSYLPYQTVGRASWFWWAHNEYLQVLVDTGLMGAILAGLFFFLLFRTAIRAAPESSLNAGLLGSLVASASHSFVDFNWQIPANAVTFVALCGLAMQNAVRSTSVKRSPRTG